MASICLKTMQEMLNEQVQYKVDYINKQELIDRSNCSHAARALEQAIRTTLSTSKPHETNFTLPFQKGCGKEVQNMLTSHQIDPLLLSNESIHTVEKLFVGFNLSKKEVHFLLTR
jgi:hypothetical protein